MYDIHDPSMSKWDRSIVAAQQASHLGQELQVVEAVNLKANIVSVGEGNEPTEPCCSHHSGWTLVTAAVNVQHAYKYFKQMTLARC